MLALRGRGVALEGGSHCPVVRGGEAEVGRRPTEGKKTGSVELTDGS